MSYDLYLKEPVTGEVASVPGHLMIGGTYRADYHPETGTFTPALNTEAHLNITYNYGEYFREVYEEGIRKIYGMSGIDSIPVLENMIAGIIKKYKAGDTWISSKRTKILCFDEEGNEVDPIQAILHIPEKLRIRSRRTERHSG